MIVVRKHKGHSGKSVYEWRVYRVTQVNTGRTVTTQLVKYRTQDEAERAAKHYEEKDALAEFAKFVRYGG